MMIEIWRSSVQGQFDATLLTLQSCLDKCAESDWNLRVANFAIGRVVFHTLFFTDLYLTLDEASYQPPGLHRENEEPFEDRTPPASLDAPYCMATMRDYLDYCREKAARVINEETESSLPLPAGFSWLALNRAELHLYNLRHIQHHAGQIICRLRCDRGTEFGWFGMTGISQ